MTIRSARPSRLLLPKVATSKCRGAHCGENTAAGEAVLAAQPTHDGQRDDRCGDKENDGGHQGVYNSVPSVRAQQVWTGR
jgi:hypothetical protein